MGRGEREGQIHVEGGGRVVRKGRTDGGSGEGRMVGRLGGGSRCSIAEVVYGLVIRLAFCHSGTVKFAGTPVVSV